MGLKFLKRNLCPPPHQVRAGVHPVCALLLFLVVPFMSGCSALFLTDTESIQHRLEVLSRIPKAEYRPIDLRLLGQTPPPEHLVGDGDVLGIYIEGGPGQESGEMPVRFPDDRNVAPAIGYPIPVRNGGYIRVPEVGLLYVRGMTIWQIEERIRHVLLNEKKTHQPDRTQIHVSLMWTRSVDVMVIRQEEQDATKLIAPSNGTDVDRRSGQVVQLPAFRNDVLNALLETGGLPSGEAENSVYVYKRSDRKIAGRQGLPAGMVSHQLNPSSVAHSATPSAQPNAGRIDEASRHHRQQNSLSATGQSVTGHSVGAVRPVNYQMQSLQPIPDPLLQSVVPAISGTIPPNTEYPLRQFNPPATKLMMPDPNSRHPNAIRIPLTVASTEKLCVSEQDVILEDGDIVLVESRNDEYFITGGLLGGGQYTLPRDRDIDIIDAVLLADTYSRSSQINQPTRAIGGVSVLNRDVTVGASRVVLERKLPDERVHRFKVNLYRAMRDPAQRILIEPGDRLFLEYTLPESVFAFVERHLWDPLLNGVPTILTDP